MMKPLTVAIALSAAVAQAQVVDPKFEFAAKEDVDAVEWKAQSKAGFILATGNASSLSAAAGLNISRKASENRFGLEGNLAYVRSTLFLAVDANASGFIESEEIQPLVQTTSQSWLLKARYDRFFAEKNSIFVTARAASDVPAGKELLGGAQLGYNRRLYKTESSETSVEAGYDFQYEEYVVTEAAVSIHSARVALQHSTKVGEANLFTVDLEGLANLNEETVPNPSGAATVPPLRDFRVNASANLTTNLSDRVGFGFTFKLRYDNVPAPRPPFAIPYAPGFVPFAERLDTVTEASLIVTFL